VNNDQSIAFNHLPYNYGRTTRLQKYLKHLQMPHTKLKFNHIPLSLLQSFLLDQTTHA